MVIQGFNHANKINDILFRLKLYFIKVFRGNIIFKKIVNIMQSAVVRRTADGFFVVVCVVENYAVSHQGRVVPLKGSTIDLTAPAVCRKRPPPKHRLVTMGNTITCISEW